ncbi:LOW QUALITY PROTEIN: hypothetical protein HID58_082018 [Brassica napus]|uniref:Uncharacterized protein n=1 Tax=Brassica napus TaxID=3708 RepID=A0ABQ7YB17_BRANA|nr:LOW QUALITY PROTEIN: hypothetical protein HID58_082018 [Brassica napus]
MDERDDTYITSVYNCGETKQRWVELWLGAAVGSLGLDLDRFHLRSGPFLLLVRRRFGLTLLGRRWVSPSGLECHLARAGFSSFSSGAGSPFLARVCVGGSLYHDNVSWFLSTIKARVGLARGSKGGCLCLLSGLLLCLFTSYPLFPIPWLVHSLEAYVIRLGMCSGLHKVLAVASGKLFSALELARWFSTASSVQVVLVSLTACFERLVFAHIPASLRFA